ncbi:MAG: DCC1-like thiol-disulfide oxidoreductase family protein [Pseudomonadota bacterium]
MEDATPGPTPSYLVYDGDCPFCNEYVKLLRLRASVGPVELVDARSEHPIVGDLHARGFDLNEGIAFLNEGVIHYGDAAVTHLALLSSPVGLFNRWNAAVFKRPTVAALVYPLLKSGRRLTLRVLGRSPIDHSSQAEDC